MQPVLGNSKGPRGLEARKGHLPAVTGTDLEMAASTIHLRPPVPLSPKRTVFLGHWGVQAGRLRTWGSIFHGQCEPGVFVAESWVAGSIPRVSTGSFLPQLPVEDGHPNLRLPEVGRGPGRGHPYAEASRGQGSLAACGRSSLGAHLPGAQTVPTAGAERATLGRQALPPAAPGATRAQPPLQK